MKKYLLIVCIAVLPLSGFSQSLFDKYEELDDVTSVVVNQSMFNLLAKIDVEVDEPEARDFMDIAKSVKSLKVFTTDNESIGADMKTSVNSYLKSSNLTELMRVKDKDANVKFYIKEGKDSDHVSELLMFVTGLKDVEADGRKFETVLLSLTGDIDLNKINSLTKKMNLPEELNKAGKQGN
ncbi:MAG: DUF4252 domain-containing protein [Croceitalea sp.]|nr:DUF4252 domain-containing protein [Croceitalea sp.]MBT8239044.1 DUF4252 domain-containing protein [Croceitalea sp.]NNC35648.1 DUF4252 domain-containing protein [Croceitalea sp.]NNL07691.1 DUF4252 domain-containing protein [Croceitalea sp.]NNM19148.1 DUF4252 domain-containing protein [Croceitalea sp.]